MKSRPRVFVLTRLYCKNVSEPAKFIDNIKRTFESVINNGYKGNISILLYDDTPNVEECSQYAIARKKMLNELFNYQTRIDYRVVNELSDGGMGSAYAQYSLRNSFLKIAPVIAEEKAEKIDSYIVILLDQDDILRKGAIKRILNRMKPGGVVVSPFRIYDQDGLDVTDDGGKIHNRVSRLLSIGCLRRFITSEKSDIAHKYGLSALGTMCWTKAYSFAAIKQYHYDLTDFICNVPFRNNNTEDVDHHMTKAQKSKAQKINRINLERIREYFATVNAYEDFIDFYLLLLKGIPITGTFKCSHNYNKHSDSITSCPNLYDFRVKRTNSLLTLINLCYAKYKAHNGSSGLRKNFKSLLLKFVASKTYQIQCILDKYRKEYLEQGKQQYEYFAAEVYDGYFVNELMSLVDKSDDNCNIADLFSSENYKSIRRYKTKQIAHSPKHILINAAKREGTFRKKFQDVTHKPKNRISSNRRIWQILITAILSVAMILLVVLLLLSNVMSIDDNNTKATLIGLCGGLFSLFVNGLGRMFTLNKEDKSNLKLYESEFTDFVRHIEANMKVLIQIHKQSVSKAVNAQNIHFENLKWPETSVLFSDDMAKLLKRDRVEDFSRLKVNARNINNSAKWLTELASKGELTVEQLEWEISRYFGYLVNLYYMKDHSYRFPEQHDLGHYIHDKCIRFKLTELFLDYEPDKRYEMVEYFISRYYEDRRNKRAVLMN